jgi:hypothetical protein
MEDMSVVVTAIIVPSSSQTVRWVVQVSATSFSFSPRLAKRSA